MLNRFHVGIAAGFLAILLSMPSAAAAQGTAAFDLQVSQTLDFAAQQALATSVDVGSPTLFPRSVDPSTGQWTTRTASDWASGFFPGMLWLLHRHTNDPDLLDAAESWTAEMAGQATRTDTHDLGFMIGIPFGLAFETTGDPSYQATYLVAASSLSSRFNANVGATRSWDFGSWQFPVIIDNMMNLELLFRASSMGTDPVVNAEWYAVASSHAVTSSNEHVRLDGTTYHLVDFDPLTGSVVSKQTFQGVDDDSTWSRGQAWAIHGFATSYRETLDPSHLATAMATADYFIDHSPADGVPYWDFEAPNIPDEPRDSSAAAVAADGLLLLSMLADNAADRSRYRNAATSILQSLMSPSYLSDGVSSAGLLLHGTGAKPFDREVDFGLIWGDYYFVSALARYQEIAARPVPTSPARWLLVLTLAVGAVATLRRRN